MPSSTPHIDRKALRGVILAEAEQQHGKGRITQVSEATLAHLDRYVVAEAKRMARYRDGTSKTINPRPQAIPPATRRLVTT